MSVYKSKKSAPYFWYDFQIGGRRFHGSTRCTNRREAEAIEAQERERARALVKASRIAAVSLQIDHVAAATGTSVGSIIPGPTTRRAIWRGWSSISARPNC